MRSPLISVVMASYNHASYVREAIDSVLTQKGVNLEFLVEDDDSSDDTAEIVRTVRDPRISFVEKSRNEGAYQTHNNLLARARGEYVAVINSDDVWLDSDKLAYQLDVLESGPEFGATFGRPVFIDQTGHALPAEATFMGRVFDQHNRSPGQWLSRFFFHGNCLCHPTVMIRKSCHERLGGYDNRLRQLADFDMWTRVIRSQNIHVSDRELVAFRCVSDGNTSWPSDSNSIRTHNEAFFVLAKIFDGVSVDLMRSAFVGVLVDPDVSEPLQVEVEKALLYFTVDGPLRGLHWSIGLQRIYSLLGEAQLRPILRDYGIDDLWLHERAGEFSAFCEAQNTMNVSAASAVVDPTEIARPTLKRIRDFLRR